jgi:hypothetical protein
MITARYRQLSVTESVVLPPDARAPMAKNTPPATCSKCGKPKRFVLVKSGGRKFRCIDCDVPDPDPQGGTKKPPLG